MSDRRSFTSGRGSHFLNEMRRLRHILIWAYGIALVVWGIIILMAGDTDAKDAGTADAENNLTERTVRSTQFVGYGSIRR